MRFLPSLLLSALACAGRLAAQTTVSGTIPTTTIVANAGAAIDLRNYFAEAGVSGNAVQFKTAGGDFYVQLNAAAAPNTVANFLAYVNSGSYANTLIHRSVPGFVIQGGTYIPNTTGTQFTSYNSVATYPPIALETADSMLNALHTISMARTSDPNSATSSWFINTVDNSSNLPPASSGGYAAFGTVIDPNNVVATLAALPIPGGTLTVTNSSTNSALVTVDSTTLPTNFGPGWGLFSTDPSFPATVQSVNGNFVTINEYAPQNITSNTSVAWSRLGPPFTQLPFLANLPSDNSMNLSNLVTVNSVTPLFPTEAGGTSVATFSATSSDPIVHAWVTGSILHLTATKNLDSSIATPPTITVTATDATGSVNTAFQVNVARKVLDLNGDKNADLAFQNTGTGQVYAWFLDGSGNSVNFTTGSGLNTTGPNAGYLYGGSLPGWRLAAIGDVNGDGIPDLVFQNTGTGQVYAFFLDGSGASVNFSTGSGIKSAGYLYGGSLPGWRLAGVADVNGDGNPDLIFQNTGTGQVYAFFLDGSGASVNFSTGSGIKGADYLYGGGLLGWRLAGVGDVNGDGIPDLVFQSTATGQIYAFALDDSGNSVNFTTGAGTNGAGYLYGGSLPGWSLAGVGDMNGDGIPDLIFQNTGTGQVYAFFLDGSGASVNFTTGSGINGAGYLYGGSLPGWQLY